MAVVLMPSDSTSIAEAKDPRALTLRRRLEGAALGAISGAVAGWIGPLLGGVGGTLHWWIAASLAAIAATLGYRYGRGVVAAVLMALGEASH